MRCSLLIKKSMHVRYIRTRSSNERNKHLADNKAEMEKLQYRIESIAMDNLAENSQLRPCKTRKNDGENLF